MLLFCLFFFFSRYDVAFGLACINEHQEDKQCEDYQVILTCPSDFCQSKFPKRFLCIAVKHILSLISYTTPQYSRVYWLYKKISGASGFKKDANEKKVESLFYIFPYLKIICCSYLLVKNNSAVRQKCTFSLIWTNRWRHNDSVHFYIWSMAMPYWNMKQLTVL